MTSPLLWFWDRLIVLSVAIQVTGAFLAPMFPEAIDPVIWGGVCHLQPERSFALGGVALPLCGRCTGIFMGFLIGRFCWGIDAISRKRLLLSLGAMMLMVLEWKLSHQEVMTSSNVIRLLTGVLFGFGFSHVFHALPLAIARDLANRHRPDRWLDFLRESRRVVDSWFL